MADLLIPSQYGNAVFSWTVSGKANPITVGLGYQVNASSAAADIADALYDTATGTDGPCKASVMLDSYTFNGITVRQNDAGTMVEAASSGSAVVGTISSTAGQTINSSFLVRKSTGLVGRKHRGRMYFPIMMTTEASIDIRGNILDATYPTLATAFAAWFIAMAGDSALYFPALLHSEILDPDIITGFALQQTIATQRRRMR